jgi:hypothetical protein
LPCRRCQEGGSIIRTLHRRGGHATLK